MTDIVSVSSLLPTWAAPATPEPDARTATPQQALHGFESLFVQMMLEHAGLAEALSGGEEGQSAVGELLVRELSQSLAQQLTLPWGVSHE